MMNNREKVERLLQQNETAEDCGHAQFLMDAIDLPETAVTVLDAANNIRELTTLGTMAMTDTPRFLERLEIGALTLLRNTDPIHAHIGNDAYARHEHVYRGLNGYVNDHPVLALIISTDKHYHEALLPLQFHCLMASNHHHPNQDMTANYRRSVSLAYRRFTQEKRRKYRPIANQFTPGLTDAESVVGELERILSRLGNKTGHAPHPQDDLRCLIQAIKTNGRNSRPVHIQPNRKENTSTSGTVSVGDIGRTLLRHVSNQAPALNRSDYQHYSNECPTDSADKEDSPPFRGRLVSISSGKGTYLLLVPDKGPGKLNIYQQRQSLRSNQPLVTDTDIPTLMDCHRLAAIYGDILANSSDINEVRLAILNYLVLLTGRKDGVLARTPVQNTSGRTFSQGTAVLLHGRQASHLLLAPYTRRSNQSYRASELISIPLPDIVHHAINKHGLYNCYLYPDYDTKHHQQTIRQFDRRCHESLCGLFSYQYLYRFFPVYCLSADIDATVVYSLSGNQDYLSTEDAYTSAPLDDGIALMNQWHQRLGQALGTSQPVEPIRPPQQPVNTVARQPVPTIEATRELFANIYKAYRAHDNNGHLRMAHNLAMTRLQLLVNLVTGIRLTSTAYLDDRAIDLTNHVIAVSDKDGPRYTHSRWIPICRQLALALGHQRERIFQLRVKLSRYLGTAAPSLPAFYPDANNRTRNIYRTIDTVHLFAHVNAEYRLKRPSVAMIKHLGFDMPFNIYRLRALFRSYMLARGCPARALKGYMGHHLDGQQTLQRYSGESFQQLADILRPLQDALLFDVVGWQS